jgi:hypothetical protein
MCAPTQFGGKPDGVSVVRNRSKRTKAAAVGEFTADAADVRWTQLRCGWLASGMRR